MPSVSLMSPSHSKAVVQLEQLAFSAYAQQKSQTYPPRTQENILACLDLNPAGCFVAIIDEPVGFIFSRRWGSVGWIGTFGVHPGFHGQKIGQSLLAAAIDHLHETGCTTIGLETMPDSPYNVGLYARLGFRPVYPTLFMEKKVELPPQSAPFELMSQLPRQDALSAITQLSRAVWAGLDYAPEAANAQDFHWGETLLWGWHEPWAFAIVRTIPKKEGESAPLCEVSALALHPDRAGQFPQVLQALETFAYSQRVAQLSIPVNAEHWSALQHMLSYRLVVNRLMQRMVLKREAPPPSGIDLSKWMM